MAPGSSRAGNNTSTLLATYLGRLALIQARHSTFPAEWSTHPDLAWLAGTKVFPDKLIAYLIHKIYHGQYVNLVWYLHDFTGYATLGVTQDTKKNKLVNLTGPWSYAEGQEGFWATFESKSRNNNITLTNAEQVFLQWLIPHILGVFHITFDSLKANFTKPAAEAVMSTRAFAGIFEFYMRKNSARISLEGSFGSAARPSDVVGAVRAAQGSYSVDIHSANFKLLFVRAAKSLNMSPVDALVLFYTPDSVSRGSLIYKLLLEIYTLAKSSQKGYYGNFANFTTSINLARRLLEDPARQLLVDESAKGIALKKSESDAMLKYYTEIAASTDTTSTKFTQAGLIAAVDSAKAEHGGKPLVRSYRSIGVLHYCYAAYHSKKLKAIGIEPSVIFSPTVCATIEKEEAEKEEESKRSAEGEETQAPAKKKKKAAEIRKV